MNPIQSFNGVSAYAVLVDIERTKNFDIGFDAINIIMDKGKKLDSIIGELIVGMEKMWVPAEHEGENFMNAAIRKTELSPDTINRHMTISDFLKTTAIPEHVKPAIEASGQKSLIRIAKAATKYDFNTEQWEKLAEACYSGEKSVGLTLQKLTNTEPRSNWLFITKDERGVLTAHGKEDGEVVHVEIGRIYISNQRPIVQKAIKRIIANSDIKEQVEY